MTSLLSKTTIKSNENQRNLRDTIWNKTQNNRNETFKKTEFDFIVQSWNQLEMIKFEFVNAIKSNENQRNLRDTIWDKTQNSRNETFKKIEFDFIVQNWNQLEMIKFEFVNAIKSNENQRNFYDTTWNKTFEQSKRDVQKNWIWLYRAKLKSARNREIWIRQCNEWTLSSTKKKMIAQKQSLKTTKRKTREQRKWLTNDDYFEWFIRKIQTKKRSSTIKKKIKNAQRLN